MTSAQLTAALMAAPAIPKAKLLSALLRDSASAAANLYLAAQDVLGTSAGALPPTFLLTNTPIVSSIMLARLAYREMYPFQVTIPTAEFAAFEADLYAQVPKLKVSIPVLREYFQKMPGVALKYGGNTDGPLYKTLITTAINAPVVGASEEEAEE